MDKNSIIETEAYTSHMQASLQIEYSEYKEAMNNLARTKIIYSKLAENKDTIEAVIYTEKIQ